MNTLFLLAFAIFVATLSLVVLRPRNLAIGYPATAGALLCLALGITTVSDVYTVWTIVWNATFTFIAVIIASLIFDEAGFFEYLALRLAGAARGHGVELFVILVLLGAGVSAVFANDGTALILTPIVYALLKKVGIQGRHAVPFIISVGFIADSASLPLVVSNLVNIVASSYFGIGFLKYAEVMVLPDAVAISSSLVLLWAYYRKNIPTHYDAYNVGKPCSVIRDPLLFRIATPSILFLIFAYSLGSIYHVPVAFVAVPTVCVLFVVASLNRRINTLKILKTAPWQIVVFSLGMYLIVFGLGREGFTRLLMNLLTYTSTLPGPLATLSSGYVFAALAAVMNNMPSVMVGNLAIAHLTDHSRLVYANVIGNDIGPKFTPVGSLATLLWIHMLERKGDIKVTVSQYMKVGFAVGLPVLFLTLMALWLT
jgi:arsenical pump membrane protein